MNDLQSQVTKLENNISSKQKSIDETAVKLEEAQKTEKKAVCFDENAYQIYV